VNTAAEMVDLYTATWILSLPTITMIFGGLCIWVTTLSQRTVAGLQHFASGILVAAVAWELVPILQPVSHTEKGAIIFGFLFAAFTLSFLGRYDFKNWRKCQGKPKHLEAVALDTAPSMEFDQYQQIRDNSALTLPTAHPPAKPRFPLGLVIAVTFDCTIDGMLIGITLTASESAGLITAIALCIEQCLLGVSLGNSMAKAKVPRCTCIIHALLVPFFVLIGGLMGCTVLSEMDGTSFHAVVSFGVGGLLYLVTEELMIEAHEDEDTDRWYISLLFFGGFVFVVALDEWLPHD